MGRVGCVVLCRGALERVEWRGAGWCGVGKGWGEGWTSVRWLTTNAMVPAVADIAIKHELAAAIAAAAEAARVFPRVVRLCILVD